MRQYLNIMEVTNGNMCVKFEDKFFLRKITNMVVRF